MLSSVYNRQAHPITQLGCLHCRAGLPARLTSLHHRAGLPAQQQWHPDTQARCAWAVTVDYELAPGGVKPSHYLHKQVSGDEELAEAGRVHTWPRTEAT